MSKDLPVFINVSKTMCLINGLFKKIYIFSNTDSILRKKPK